MSEVKLIEVDYKSLIEMNYRVLTLLGIATAIIMDYKKLEDYHDNSYRCDWFFSAMEDVVYKNKPISFEGFYNE